MSSLPEIVQMYRVILPLTLFFLDFNTGLLGYYTGLMLSTMCQQELHMLISKLPNTDVLLPAAGPQSKAIFRTHSHIIGISEDVFFQNLLILNIVYFSYFI